MAARGIKSVQLQARMEKGQIGPSPFPLLILTLILAVIFMIKVRAGEKNLAGSVTSQEVRSALPNYLD